MSRRRVVVTGMGAVTPYGLTTDALWAGVCVGRPAFAPLPAYDPPLTFSAGAAILDFDPAAHVGGRTDLLDRFAQLALLAARAAVAEAGLHEARAWRADAAIVTGTGAGGRQETREGRDRVHPFTIPRAMANAGACAIAMDLGVTGPTYTVSTACAASAHALGLAYLHVREGLADVALAGGSEAPFTRSTLRAWSALRVVSPDRCRPFSAERSGMLLGEAGAMLVVEALEHARARGARVLGEIVGFGMTGDAHHITQPSSAGAAAALRRTLADAALPPEAIGYVNAHGTGTLVNDPAEAAALHAALGPAAARVPVSSTKGAHGHTLGAAGALEAIVTLCALRDGLLPPTAGFGTPDPACALDVVADAPRPSPDVEYALSNSFAFGGLNAVLAFRRAEA